MAEPGGTQWPRPSETKTNTLLIRTPEGIVFSLLLAGPIIRFLAWGIDLACIITATTLSNQLLSLAEVISIDLSRALILIAYFFISIGYGIIMEWYWRGQTIGKRLLRLRVMDVRGLRLRESQVIIRNILRFVDSLPLFYFIGGTVCLFSRRAQRLGDLAANTIVVRNPRIADPDLDQIMSGKYNSLREYPHLATRFRQKVSPKEANIALQALLRRDELEPEARVELFKNIARHFRSIVDFPEEALIGITDEQYVRNMVDILFMIKPASANENNEPRQRD
ncbi:MAG: RDD family protein [Deltaproteobacteria bacterium]|nr:RDD family protein [Deltaproteobacteria bacterium]